jgi:hypothetical protein
MRLLTAFIALTLLAAACGSDSGSPALPSVDSVATDDPPADATPPVEAPPADNSSNPAPEASGPVAMNTIRVGSQVWERTLPMTTGQCYLQEDDGNLPTSASVWGTLDGDENLSFSVRVNQDGTFEASLDNNLDFFWIAGPRSSEVDDLVVELDFATQTIRGSGTFVNAGRSETAIGSFEFRCVE